MKEKIIYIVLEDYTCAFCGLYNTLSKAERIAESEGGFVLRYGLKNGKWYNLDDDMWERE